MNPETTATDADPAALGWTPHPDTRTPRGLDGPFWMRRGGGPDGNGLRFATQTSAEHSNNQGAVHGGVILAFIDHGLGMAVRASLDGRRAVTIQLDTQFVSAARPGALLELETEITRGTRSVVFVRGRVLADGALAATANGIWKVRESAG